jgi:pimeloyl-ACP methyl ester carboxylesterase
MAERPGSAFRRTSVRSGGVRLAAWSGSGSGPPVLFVHGYPDTHDVWDPILERLTGRYRCLAYDVRGAGSSAAPPGADAYRLHELRADLRAVIDALSPDRPVHLVGHDWGSTLAWDLVIREPRRDSGRATHADARDPASRLPRIASFTSISGPCLHHVSAFTRSAMHGGWGGRGGLAAKRALVVQAWRSWYVYAFQVPLIPDIAVRRRSARLLRSRGDTGTHFGSTLPDDAVNGLNLYRANVLHREPAPNGANTDVPVQVVVPLRDKYVTPALTENSSRFASNLTRVEIDAGHWVMRSHPDHVAQLIADFVTSTEAGTDRAT